LIKHDNIKEAFLFKGTPPEQKQKIKLKKKLLRSDIVVAKSVNHMCFSVYFCYYCTSKAMHATVTFRQAVDVSM
jgi:hypothetical protein